MIKLKFLFEDRGNCRQVFKGDNDKYYCRVENNFYTVYPSNGYYEPSSSIDKDNFTIEGEGAEYTLIGDFCKSKTKDLKEKLKTYEERKEYLLKEWDKKGYYDNWLWNMEKIKEEVIEEYNYLGLRLKLIKTESIHKISKKKIIEYAIYQDEYTCECLVGYEF